MRIVIGLDHAGFALKEDILTYLEGLVHKMLDLVLHNTNPANLPNYAEAVGLAIQRGQAERGILICDSGVGVSVAAKGCRVKEPCSAY